MVATPRYRGAVYDSVRWEGFSLRPGDLVVSTPPKCGTTWTQMVLALLVHGLDLPSPLATLSPFLDLTTRPRRDVVAALESQRHRRIIKTHTPLDGLPHEPAATYVVVGRDPRDVALSMDDHLDNLDLAAVAVRQAEAAAIDGLPHEPAPPRPSRPASARERFWEWVDGDAPPTEVASSLRRTLHHLGSALRPPGGLDVVTLHFDDLKDDLEGSMRALAGRVGASVPASTWPAIVEAATFEHMRARAPLLAPGTDTGVWRDPQAFFRAGRRGGWAALLDGADRDRYRRRAEELGPEDVVTWVHRPPL